MGRSLVVFVALGLLPASAQAATNTISTVAGDGTPGFTGDSGSATSARLNIPVAVVATPDGGYLIADQINHRVRRVSAGGTITTVAGNGTAAYTGDGGSALAATMNAPTGVTPTADGGFLIADGNNNAIRRVTPGGIISTVVGGLGAGYNGDGIPATTAQLSFPADVAATFDGGYLIADNDNNRIRKVSFGGTITTVAGTGTAGFTGDGTVATTQLNDPRSVAPTSDGGFLVADTNNRRVRRVLAGAVTTVAGDGTPAQLAQPVRVAPITTTDFLIADGSGHRVRRSSGGSLSTVAGDGTAGFSGDGGPASAARLNLPSGVAVDAGNDFLIADALNHRIRHIDAGDPGAVPNAPPAEPQPEPQPTPAPTAPPVARNITPPRVQITAGKTGYTHSCSSGTWEGLAADPQFVREIWKGRNFLDRNAKDELVTRSKAVFLSKTATSRLYYCVVIARTAAGGTISARGDAVRVPSPPLLNVGEGRPRADQVLTQKTTGDYRVRGIDVLQVSQPSSGAGQFSFEGFPTRDRGFPGLCGGGTPTSLAQPGCTASGAASQTAPYQGVTIDPDKRASVVVYVDRKAGEDSQVPSQPLQVRLRGVSPGRLNASLTQTITMGSLDAGIDDAVSSIERGTESYGVRFDLPQEWLIAVTSPTNGTFDLEAAVSIAPGSPGVIQCRGQSLSGVLNAVTSGCQVNDTYKLTDVPARFLPFQPIIQAIALTTPGQGLSTLNPPGQVFQRARDLLPGGEGIVVSGGYTAQLFVDPRSFIRNPASCPGAPMNESRGDMNRRIRFCGTAQIEDAMTNWVLTELVGGTRGADGRGGATPRGYGYHILAGVHSYLNAQNRQEPGASFNNFGPAAFGRPYEQPYIHVNDGSGLRPLTSATHELVHAFGAPHAGVNRGGIAGDASCGGDTNDQVGEVWPTDNSGRLQGVQFNAASGRIVDSDENRPGQLRRLYDLMSYCGNEARAWLSPRNWNRVFAAMIDAESAAARVSSASARTSQAGGVPIVTGSGYVSGLVVDGAPKITRTEPARATLRVPAGDPDSNIIVRSSDANGRVLGELGARVRQSSEGGGTFLAPVPKGAAKIELVVGGTVVDTRSKGRAPTLRLSSPRAGARARRALDVRWQASDPDRSDLVATVQFSANGRSGWRTIYYGPSTGSARLPADLLQAAERARVRVRVSDGFDAAEVTSPPFRSDGTRPDAEIVRPDGAEGLSAAARVVLEGQARDDGNRRLRGRALTWFAGRKRLGSGERLRVKLPAGRVRLRLVATGSRGRERVASQTLRVAPVPLEITTLRAKAVRAGATRTTMTIATNVAGTLSVRGRRYPVSARNRRVRITLPGRPKSGVLQIPMRVRPADGGKTVKATLIVLR